MRPYRFIAVLLFLILLPASGRADLRGPLYNPTEYAKVERYIGGFLLFDRSLSLRNAGFLEGGISFQIRPRGILILGVDLFLQLGIDNFQFTAVTQRSDSSRTDIRRWQQRQGGYQQVVEMGPVMTMETTASEALSAYGFHAGAGGRVHVGASLWRFDITAFFGATVGGDVMTVPGVGLRGTGDFRLETGLQLLLNVGAVRFGVRAGVGVFESHLTDAVLDRSMQMCGPTGAPPAPLDYNPDGGPLDVKQVTTGTMRSFLESHETRREDRIDLKLCLVLVIPWSEPGAAPFPHHLMSYGDAEASRPAVRTPPAIAPPTTAPADGPKTATPEPVPHAPTQIAGGPVAASTGDAAPDEPAPSLPSVALLAAPAPTPPPLRKHPMPHRAARVPIAKSTAQAVTNAPITTTTPTAPTPAAEPPSRAISALANQVEGALSAADSALDQIAIDDLSAWDRTMDALRLKLLQVDDLFEEFRRSKLRLLVMFRDALARARALAAAADAATSEAERKRLLHASTVLLLRISGEAQILLLLTSGAVYVSHAEKAGVMSDQTGALSRRLHQHADILLHRLRRPSGDADLLQTLDLIDQGSRIWSRDLDRHLAAMIFGGEKARKVIAVLNIASLALSLYQVARIPVVPSGGAPALPPVIGVAGGAAVAGRVGPLALAETAEAIKKLIAIGALDPAVATIGTGPALPANRPVLPKLEPLRQDTPPTDTTGGSAAAPPTSSGELRPELRLRPENVEEVIDAVKKRYGLSAKEAKLIRQAAKTDKEKWKLPDALRGKVSHVLAGENLPPSTETIDHVGAIGPNGVAADVTSFKSHNLYAESMRKPGGTFETIKRDIDALSNYGERPVNGGPSIGRFSVTAGTKRVLQVEVPSRALRHIPGETDAAGRLREQFIKECDQARAYATSKGIELRFVEAGQ